jgi:hypothetical protein
VGHEVREARREKRNANVNIFGKKWSKRRGKK